MVQLTGNATDETVEEIQCIAGDQYTVEDKRDQKTSGTYMAFVGCVYGFLLIIALVTMLSMVNNISMSVSARTKEYGIMWAVGMDKEAVSLRAIEAVKHFVRAVIHLPLGQIVVNSPAHLFAAAHRDHAKRTNRHHRKLGHIIFHVRVHDNSPSSVIKQEKIQLDITQLLYHNFTF